jgi:hypothetical protein
MAVALARLFAQIHHVSAYCLWSNGDFCEVLLTVTEVHCQKHLKTEGDTRVTSPACQVGFTLDLFL